MNNLFRLTAMAALLSATAAIAPGASAQSMFMASPAPGCNACASGAFPANGLGAFNLLNDFNHAYWDRPLFGVGRLTATPYHRLTSSAVIERDWPVVPSAPGVVSLIRPRVRTQMAESPVF